MRHRKTHELSALRSRFNVLVPVQMKFQHGLNPLRSPYAFGPVSTFGQGGKFNAYEECRVSERTLRRYTDTILISF